MTQRDETGKFVKMFSQTDLDQALFDRTLKLQEQFDAREKAWRKTIDDMQHREKCIYSERDELKKALTIEYEKNEQLVRQHEHWIEKYNNIDSIAKMEILKEHDKRIRLTERFEKKYKTRFIMGIFLGCAAGGLFVVLMEMFLHWIL